MRNLEIGSRLKRGWTTYHVKSFQNDVPVAGRLTEEELGAARSVVAELDEAIADSGKLQHAISEYETEGKSRQKAFQAMIEDKIRQHTRGTELSGSEKSNIIFELSGGISTLAKAADYEFEPSNFQHTHQMDDGTTVIRRCPFKTVALKWKKPLRDAGLR